MILSDLRTSFDNSSDETSSSSNYWHRDRATYSEQQIDEMPTWVKTEKEQVTDVSHPNNDVFDINALSEMQKLSYKYCQQTPSRHFRRKGPIVSHNYRCNQHREKLINALRNSLQSRCAVKATTGKALYNIKGVTIHLMRASKAQTPYLLMSIQCLAKLFLDKQMQTSKGISLQST